MITAVSCWIFLRTRAKSRMGGKAYIRFPDHEIEGISSGVCSLKKFIVHFLLSQICPEMGVLTVGICCLPLSCESPINDLLRNDS